MPLRQLLVAGESILAIELPGYFRDLDLQSFVMKVAELQDVFADDVLDYLFEVLESSGKPCDPPRSIFYVLALKEIPNWTGHEGVIE